jgi:hypothetical protein
LKSAIDGEHINRIFTSQSINEIKAAVAMFIAAADALDGILFT